MKVPDLKFDEKNAKDSGTADLETAITLTRFGKFHIFLIGVGGFCFLCSGFEYGLHAYVLPFAQCDLQITTAQMGIINAMFLGGSILCSFIWGAAADTIGRKKVLMIAMALDGVATILASWSPSYLMFALVRFMSGFMCGAPGCLVNSYVGEFCSNKHRSRGICLIGFCWTLAWLLLPGLAWLIIPSSFSFSTPVLEYSTWRVFVGLIGLPNLIAAVIICYCLTETPKFLFVQGRQAEALEILKMMYRRNTGQPEENYPVRKLVAKYTADAEESGKVDAKEHAEVKTMKEIFIMMGNQIKQIFTPPHLSKTILSSSIYFANFFGYYGLGLWLPELFNRFEAYYAQHPNETVTVCELSRYKNLTALKDMDEAAALQDLLSDCGDRTINLAVFQNTFIIGAVTCLGNIIAIVLTNKVGGRLLSGKILPKRNIILGAFRALAYVYLPNAPSVSATLLAGACSIAVYFTYSEVQIVLVNCLFMTGVGTAMITIGTTNMIISGLCGCYIYFVSSPIQIVILSSVFVATVNSALNVHNYCVVNLFPTYIRAMGVCIGILFGRVGAVSSNLVFGMLLDISCEIPIFLLGGTVIFGGLLCLLLPKDSQKAVE